MFLRTKKTRLVDLSDDDLLKQYRLKKDKKYIGALFNRYIHLLYGAANKYLDNKDEAKDLVMDLFEKLIAKPLPDNIDSLSNYLSVLVRNECLNRIRSRKRKAQHELLADEEQQRLSEVQSYDEIMDEQPEAQEALFDITVNGHQLSIDNTLLKKALNHLKKEQRTCLKLFYFEKQSYQEIARKTGLEIKKVKSHLQNGKRLLKGYFEQTALNQY